MINSVPRLNGPCDEVMSPLVRHTSATYQESLGEYSPSGDELNGLECPL